MISFDFRISNPFAVIGKKNTDPFMFYKFKHFDNHKTGEIQISSWDTGTLFSFELDTEMKGHDHAGPKLSINLFDYELNISLHDQRHWNYKKNRWYEQHEQTDW